MIPRVYDSGRKRQWWVTVIHFLSACAVRLELPAAASASKGQAANSSDPGPIVIGKSQGVDDIPADRQSCQSRDCESLYHLVAEEQAPSGLWRKGGGKALGALLFVDIGS